MKNYYSKYIYIQIKVFGWTPLISKLGLGIPMISGHPRGSLFKSGPELGPLGAKYNSIRLLIGHKKQEFVTFPQKSSLFTLIQKLHLIQGFFTKRLMHAWKIASRE